MSGADDDDSHIIASVRRILGEDAAQTRTGPSVGGAPTSDDVFELSPDMLIEPVPPHSDTAPMRPAGEASPLTSRNAGWSVAQIAASPSIGETADADSLTTGHAAPVAAPPEASAELPVHPEPHVDGHGEAGMSAVPARDAADTPVYEEPVIETRTADLAGDAFGSLRHTLRQQRDAAGAASGTASAALATRSHAGGPTIEDMIREELRPLLKVWLDAHLPELVDRAVRAEIARIVDQARD